MELLNPYYKWNYAFIISKMEKGAIAILHERHHGIALTKALDRKKYKYGFTKEPDNTWKLFIKDEKEVKFSADEKYDKIFQTLLEGGVVKGTMGDFLATIREFKKRFPRSKKSVKHEKGSSGYSIWLI